MLKHFTLIAAAILMLAVPVSAETLNIRLNDGTKASIKVSDDLEVAMTNTTFSVHSAKENISFEMAEIQSFKYADFESGVNSVTGDDTQVAIFADRIAFIGKQPGNIAVYSIDGRRHSAQKSSEGEVVLKGYPAGCYVLVFDNRSIKFTIK